MDGRKLLLGLALVALAAGTWWLTHRAAEAPPPEAGPAAREPDYVIENFLAHAMNEAGTPKYRLSAERLLHYPDDDTAHLIEPVLVQYLARGARTTTVARTGIMPGDGSEILMRGDVQVTRTGEDGRPGGEIRADRLRIELDR
jgi:lipopolysaccharide export system protein LptC